ncbi:MAG: adenylate/guanylate cyclase domain-containing protein [Candidatus Loosdrechtia sp.]|uniref:adenylate/guanylate cyclase domain-containing protein n=1 Tax=Candidatus Loosdrechtia sp. TaxID=3101272 RepID=UPI00403B1D8E
MSAHNPFLTIFGWLAKLGAHPDDSDDLRLKKAIFGVAASLAALFLAFQGLVYWRMGETSGAVIRFALVAFMIVTLAIYAKTHRNLDRMFVPLAFAALLSHTLATITQGGVVNSAGALLWGLFFPVISSVIMQNVRWMVFWFAAYATNFALAIYLDSRVDTVTGLSEQTINLIFVSEVIIISLFITVIMAFFLRQRDVAFRLLHGEQVKAENLLLNILPSDIAAILKNESRVIADHFDSASILFADVVNFTPMSASMTPVELVNLLNEVFSDFDALVEKYGLEKIKTIGDCYMVASGVPRPRADHAHALVRMALEMRDIVAKRTFNGQQLNFRMGINSGPVVAGVIGREKFIYDLWGDAVNTASRMESHGAGGAVQITRDTYDLIQHDFICEPRGTMTIKGKGEMDVWLVTGEKRAD